MRLALVLASFCMLAILLLIAAPHLIRLEPIKRNILLRLSHLTGGQLHYQRIHIDYLPRPELVFLKAELALPDRLHIAAEELRVVPEVIPLLQGQVELGRIDLLQPHMEYRLASRDPDKPPAAISFPTPEDLHDDLIAWVSHPLFQKASLRYTLQDGSLTLIHPIDGRLNFDHIQARIQRDDDRLALELQCESNLWQGLHLSGQAETSGERAAVRLQLKGFQPHKVAPAFFASGSVPMVESLFDLTAQLRFSPGVVQAELNGKRGRLVLQSGTGPVEFRGRGFRSIVTVQPDTTIVALNRLQLDAPALEVSGTFFRDRSLPEIRVDLSGTGVRVEPLRERLLAVAGHFQSVRDLFQVLTGGHVPLVSINLRGKSFAELTQIENFIVRGSIARGSVHIPGIDLDVSAVKGEVAIDKGLLKAQNLQAQMADTIGYDGRLTLGLRSRRAPFHLDIETLADMRQLVPVLLRLVKNDVFQKEMGRMSQLSGKARGRLVIGEQLSALAVNATVAYADLQADYARLPHPVEITGGSYSLSQNSLSFSNVQAAVGSATFTNVTGAIDWRPVKRLRVTTEEAIVSIPDFLNWLEKFPVPHPGLNDLAISSGRARLSDVYIEGPSDGSGHWRYDFSGVLTETIVRLPHQPQPFRVPEGRFTLRNPGKGVSGITVKPTRIQWAGGWIQMAGIGELSRDSLDLDLDLKTEKLSWNLLQKTFDRRPSSPDNAGDRKLRGIVGIRCELFHLGDLRFGPVEAAVRLNTDATTVEIIHANLCGVAIPGSIRFAPGRVDLNLRPSSHGQTLAPVITCLSRKDEFASGAYEFSSRLHASAKTTDLLPGMSGDLRFLAKNGRIYRYSMLAKILALVNVTEILRGRLPDIGAEGFAYETIEARGKVQKGILTLNDMTIRGASMTIVIGGDIDLVDETLDLKGFVAPLKTFDDVVQNLPLLSWIFENRHLMAIPFSIRGKWNDYYVIPLSTSTSTREIEGDSLESLKTNPQSVDPQDK